MVGCHRHDARGPQRPRRLTAPEPAPLGDEGFLAYTPGHAIEELELAELPPEAKITISIGVATEVPAGDRAPEELLRRADASLYTAKNEGRNLVHSNPGFKVPKDLFGSNAD